MPRPISATVSVSALAHNLDAVRRHLDQTAAAAGGVPPSIWAVIKANAYGHGIEQAVAGFSKAQGLAMLDLEEAVRCREAGWGGPILLLEGFFNPSDLDIVDRYHLSTTVHQRDQLDMLARARLSRRVDIMLKLNSGMNRLGFTPAAFPAAFERAMLLQQQGTLGSVGKMTHFACADGPQGVNEQLSVFNSVTHKLPGAISVCNSAAALRFADIAVGSESQSHWVRPGICLYGASPFADAEAASFGLKPAMSLNSEIIAVQEIKAGDSVGYGALFRAERAMRIGIVACGYADGYPRHASTGTPVVVAGIRTQLLGRVSMDMLVVDLGPVPSAGVGSPVCLWGEDGPSVDEVASAAGTIGYELLCALAPRVPVTRDA
ncbi:alanine racemase [Achromobacter mucicolens]|jgi:alanine racemase|uniref:Alanine racemase n=1 Tax=Achromobacter mucicolens TaxID=1389922 RepID=A0ABD4YX87_9BURK|nr:MULTISPECIES: alanine racemase [Achromobacter]KXJ64577.1 alanine racemase [Achromobacter xylosoxidans]KRB12213.1 alanine racemase [Achromobacter sp. Root170]MCP2515815.1 alanine racemase [Achromobacter mucicolens]MCU6618056.1 alanine racemase [Achromobacter mucicolens]MDH1178964.1 alanine racemase [Achromobacter mucicolens]